MKEHNLQRIRTQDVPSKSAESRYVLQYKLAVNRMKFSAEEVVNILS